LGDGRGGLTAWIQLSYRWSGLQAMTSSLTGHSRRL
jgi:hypothetical protein